MATATMPAPAQYPSTSKIEGYFQGAVLIIVLFYALRILLKKPTTDEHLKAEVDNSNLAQGVNYSVYATNLRNAFYGLDWASTKAQAMDAANNLNDDEFKAVYNIYNELYATAPETLKSHASAEWIWGRIVNDFIARHERLRLP